MRTSYFLKNFTSRIVIYLATSVLSFAVRTVFIYCLGEEYLGISGLFASVLTVLNLAELGVVCAFSALAVSFESLSKVDFISLFSGRLGLNSSYLR